MKCFKLPLFLILLFLGLPLRAQEQCSAIFNSATITPSHKALATSDPYLRTSTWVQKENEITQNKIATWLHTELQSSDNISPEYRDLYLAILNKISARLQNKNLLMASLHFVEAAKLKLAIEEVRSANFLQNYWRKKTWGSDRAYLENKILSEQNLANIMYYENSQGMTSENYVFTFKKQTLTDIIRSRGLRVQPIQLNIETEYTDGVEMDPVRFFIHDLDHARDVRRRDYSSTEYLSSAQKEAVLNAEYQITEEMLADIATFQDKKKALATRFILFYELHENGRTVSDLLRSGISSIARNKSDLRRLQMTMLTGFFKPLTLKPWELSKYLPEVDIWIKKWARPTSN